MSGASDQAAALARLAAAPWLNSEDVRRVMVLLGGRQKRTRFVGGVVRDTLLERLSAKPDLDLATELLPDEVMALAKQAGIGAYPTGIAHGTVTLRAGALNFEVTTLRQDIGTDGRHAEVRFGTDWAADAARRDFTLNALYCDMDGTLFDPLEGIGDCLGRRVRFIGDAAARIAEDRLRVYRFFRFSAQLGAWPLDEAGLGACRAAAGALDALSAERVGAEMLKLMAAPKAAAILAQMADAKIVDMDAAALAALDRHETLAGVPSALARLAILLVFGDGAALQAQWRLSNAQLAQALAIRTSAYLLIDGRLAEAAYRQARAVPLAVAVAGAIAGWTRAEADNVHAELAALHVPDFPVDGEDIKSLGVEPGPELGRVLKGLEARWIASGFRLDRAALLALVAEI